MFGSACPDQRQEVLPGLSPAKHSAAADGWEECNFITSGQWSAPFREFLVYRRHYGRTKFRQLRKIAAIARANKSSTRAPSDSSASSCDSADDVFQSRPKNNTRTRIFTFYLRGLESATARSLVMMAFVGQALLPVPCDQLQHVGTGKSACPT